MRLERNPDSDDALRVVVVDHRRAFSEAMAVRLGQEPDVVVEAIANSLEAGEAVLEGFGPTVGTVAIDLPGGGGLVLISRMQRSHPDVGWVVVGNQGEPRELALCLLAGASGYVSKDSPATALIEALRGAAAGLSVTPQELLHRAIAELDSLELAGFEGYR